MRIISGELGGRLFDSPRNHKTHPMSDKIRGGLFNTLGDITGLRILDAFSGSGALGFEAISRGAIHATALENDRAAQQTIAANSILLDVHTKFKLVRATVGAWLDTSEPDQLFDVVLCDPPYQDLQLPTIMRLCGRVVDGGILVLSWPGHEPAPELPGLATVKHKSYGDAQLIFYKHPS